MNDWQTPGADADETSFPRGRQSPLSPDLFLNHPPEHCNPIALVAKGCILLRKVGRFMKQGPSTRRHAMASLADSGLRCLPSGEGRQGGSSVRP